MKFAALLLLVSLQAQALIENPYLYEVRKGQAVSWMLGTQHMGIDLSELIQYVEPRLKVSRKSFTEVVVSKERIELWSGDPERAVLTSDQFDWSKGDPLSPETKQLFRANFRLPESLLNKLRSGHCSIVSTFDFQRASPKHLDFQILQLAEKLNIPRAALDTDDLRAKANKADREGRLAPQWKCDMDFMAKRKSTAESIVQLMGDEYRLGHIKPGIDMMMEGVALRNHAWMDTLTPEFEQGEVFVSVGVGHMHGPSGLIQLLREQGFSVTRFPHPED